MRNLVACMLFSAAVALGACSAPEEAPAGAMESFAQRHAANEASDKADRIEAARAREVARAADARQKAVAEAGMERFEQAEKALDATEADKAGDLPAGGFTSEGAALK